MRVDKFLWSVRVYKTRSIATDACRKARVKINDAVVKPSKEVSIGDQIEVRKQAVYYSYKVIDIPKSRVGAKLVDNFYEDETPQSEIEKLELIRLGRPMQVKEKRKYKGRPTKKERRDREKLLGDE